MAIFRAKSTLLKEEHGQMARAKRHFLPGHVWHITHRCHKKEFLLKFARDRCRWLQWLFEAKKRYRDLSPRSLKGVPEISHKFRRLSSALQ